MLGKRESDIYGNTSLADIKKLCANTAKEHNLKIEFKQSNYEGQIVEWIQKAQPREKLYQGIIINAAAYTHTSIAILDALRMLSIPIIEVHLSDIKKREPYRHKSYISEVAREIICGKGADGYKLAIECLAKI
jgi:3-dehydroquinate dehydratase-2